MKPWYTSKTLWVQVIAGAAIAIQSQTGFVISGELQAAVLLLVNVAVRAFTSSELTA